MLPSPSLAELVVDIPCGIVERSTTASCSNALETSSSSEVCGLADIAASDDADELFRQKCAILQRLLADRASSGSRLAALHLRLRPSTVSGLDELGSGSDESADEGGAVETSVVWPTHTIRQFTVQGLQELVDGLVTSDESINRTGGEMCIREWSG